MERYYKLLQKDVYIDGMSQVTHYRSFWGWSVGWSLTALSAQKG